MSVFGVGEERALGTPGVQQECPGTVGSLQLQWTLDWTGLGWSKTGKWAVVMTGQETQPGLVIALGL